MVRYWLVAGAAAVAISAPAAADPGKNEGGKRWEEQRKFQEKAFEQRKKRAEKAYEHRKKWAEKAGKRYEKALERREKAAEKRFEAEKKWAERQDKAIEKAYERRAKRLEKLQERQRKHFERDYDDAWEAAFERRARQLRLPRVGQRLEADRKRYVPYWYRDRYVDNDDYYYRYDERGYLYRVNRNNNLVSALIPVLGGGYSVGQMLPVSYADPVPMAYRDVYYDTDAYHYRYGDGAIYRVNAGTGIIESIVALLTGNPLSVGSRLPLGYDAYNVPLQYRSRYHDTANAWYRYNDGYIYQVDPTTRLITAAIDAIA